MLALLDNDIICKLVACNLFDEALALIGCTRADARALRTSKWTIGKRARFNSKSRNSIISRYGERIAREIGDLLETLEEVPAPSPATDDLLVGADIDPGEAQLFRVAYEDHRTIVLTSDRRALEELLTSGECEAHWKRLVGRIVTFESALRGLIRAHGYTWVAARVGNEFSIDGVLSLAFSDGAATSEAHVVECLESYSRAVAVLLRSI